MTPKGDVMAIVLLDMAMSLDGFIAGPNDESQGLHDWFFPPSGTVTAGDAEVIDESIKTTGAIVMGRRAYDLGDKVDGFLDTPYRVEHFVLSHDIPEQVAKGETTFTFVTDGIESVLEQAKVAAGDGNVAVGGGASIAQQCIKARLVDEIQIHLVPVLLGDGIRLFEHLDTEQIELERTRVIESPFATHLRFRVIRED
jgi:dihydrofolate reductase